MENKIKCRDLQEKENNMEKKYRDLQKQNNIKKKRNNKRWRIM